MNIVILFGCFVTAILALFFVRKSRERIEAVSLIAIVVESFIVYDSVMAVIANGQFGNGYFILNGFSALILATNTIVGIVATVYAVGYLRGELHKKMISISRLWQCFVMMQVFLLALSVAVTVTIPMVMWIAIEATTLSTAFLIHFFQRKGDIEASWKYLIINTTGLLLALLGTILFSVSVQSEGIVTWESMIRATQSYDPAIITMAFVFVFIGYGTKLGLVPMHTWKPDAYNKGPIPIVAILATGLVNTALFAILKFKTITDMVVQPAFTTNLLLVFGCISVVFSAFVLYTQYNFKRFFAYSSIEHAGFMLVGFALGGLGAYASLLHMVYHSFIKSLLFMVAGNIALRYSSSKSHDVQGVLRILPKTAVLFLIGFIAISGIPPSGIFLTELSVVLSALEQYPVVSVILPLSFVAVFIGMVRLVMRMLYGEPNADIPRTKEDRWTVVPLAIMAGIIIILSLTLPTPVIQLLQRAQSTIGR